MIAILALSLALLLAVLAALEVMEQEDVVGWAQNEFTLGRLGRMASAVGHMDAARVEDFLDATSSCHEGYTLTDEPFPVTHSADGAAIAARVARGLAVEPRRVSAGHALLRQDDFSYRACDAGAIGFPVAGIVVSLELDSGRWLNAEVHPHEWHVRRDLIGWIARTLGAFLFVGAIAVFFVRRLSRPLNELTAAARRFGQGLQVSSLREGGPPDLRRAICAFNTMQQQVSDEFERRAQTLAAIGHDLRTPLTALRIKAELVEDEAMRTDLVSSVDAMDRITTSALAFLRGESRGEPMRIVDIGALLASECGNFQDAGRDAVLVDTPAVRYACRPDALACAVRNLIENAIKYGGAAEVALREGDDCIEISVSDRGPGIPDDRIAQALEPFERLSQARESGQGGFGLGLAIVRAIVEGHDGELVLAPNLPTGLVATMRLPCRPNPLRA